MGLILLILLILLLVAALPATWPNISGWRCLSSGGLWIGLLTSIILLTPGYI
jgi:hypothetical protein